MCIRTYLVFDKGGVGILFEKILRIFGRVEGVEGREHES